MKSDKYREELTKEVEVLLYNHSDTVSRLISGHLLYEFINTNKNAAKAGFVIFSTPFILPYYLLL